MYRMGLLVEVDGTAKLGVQHHFELFHPPFALFCGGGQVGKLDRDVGLILFESFQGSGLRKMEERFADLVWYDLVFVRELELGREIIERLFFLRERLEPVLDPPQTRIQLRERVDALLVLCWR